MLPASVGILVERQEAHAALDGVLQHRRQHERPVHLERGFALLERQPRGALVGLGDRRVGARRGGNGLHDLQRLDGRGAMLGGVGQRDGLAVIGKHLTASAFQQRVEPHHQTLVLLGLQRDPARLALGVQPRRLGHHAVPRGRRLVHQIRAVPKQLGVRRDRARRTACPATWPSPAARAACCWWRRPRPGRTDRRKAATPNPPRRTRRSTPRRAPSRRVSCRCRSAAGPVAGAGRRRSFGKLICWMVKRPPSSSLHRLATAVNVAISLAGV